MKKTLLIFSAVTLSVTASAQKFRILSFESLGGDKSDHLNPLPQYNTYDDGTFSLNIRSNSDTGNIPLNCTPSNAFSHSRRIYSKTNGQYLNTACAWEADSVGITYYRYPQSNGDVLFLGTYMGDIGIERQDSNGNLLWVKHYGSTTHTEGTGNVAVSSDGNFFIQCSSLGSDGDVGTHYGSAFTHDIWVVKVDTNGDLRWGAVLGGSQEEFARTILAGDDGSCYVFGLTGSDDYDAIGQKGGGDLFIVKLDSLGNKVWTKCYGGSRTDAADYRNAVFAVPDDWGGYYVLCRTDSDDGDVQSKSDNVTDLWLVHIDRDGNILWERTYGGPTEQFPDALCRDANGNLWLGANISCWEGNDGEDALECFGNGDVWILQVDSSGNIINQRTIGTNQREDLNLLYPLNDGTVMAVGMYFQEGGLPHPSTAPHTPGFPTTNRGNNDLFIAHLSPDTDLSVKDNKSILGSWAVFPNPSDGNVTVRVDGKTGKHTVRILDIAGNEVYTGKLHHNELHIDSRSWANGIYTVILSDSRGNSEGKKITISK